MTDTRPVEAALEALLERAADRVPVSPPPAERLAREAARARRGRVTMLASAAAVLVIAGGLAGVAGLGGDEPDPVGPTSPTTTPETAPPGTRLVGLGSAAIAVPEDWGTNETRCGVPERNTVVIDAGPVELCMTSRAAGVDSVEVGSERAIFDPAPDEMVTVDGQRARLEPTTCFTDRGGVSTCQGTLRFPTLDVWFHVVSSTDADTVDRLLEGVRVLDGQVGVPGFEQESLNEQERSGETYAALLRREGFAVRSVAVDSDFPLGFVVGASPDPGTVVDVGSEVVVEVSAGD